MERPAIKAQAKDFIEQIIYSFIIYNKRLKDNYKARNPVNFTD